MRFRQTNPACFIHPDAAYVETYLFDYQEGTSMANLAAKRGISTTMLEARLSEVGMTLNQGDVNFDGNTAQSGGHVIKAMHPMVHLPEFSLQASKEGGLTQVAEELFRLLNDGLLLEKEDPEGVITAYSYNANGLLDTTTVDALSTSRRRFTGPLEQITTQNIYRADGNFISRIDERGVENEYEITALNLLVRETKAVRIHPNSRAGYGADTPPTTMRAIPRPSRTTTEMSPSWHTIVEASWLREPTRMVRQLPTSTIWTMS